MDRFPAAADRFCEPPAQHSECQQCQQCQQCQPPVFCWSARWLKPIEFLACPLAGSDFSMPKSPSSDCCTSGGDRSTCASEGDPLLCCLPASCYVDARDSHRLQGLVVVHAGLQGHVAHSNFMPAKVCCFQLILTTARSDHPGVPSALNSSKRKLQSRCNNGLQRPTPSGQLLVPVHSTTLRLLDTAWNEHSAAGRAQLEAPKPKHVGRTPSGFCLGPPCPAPLRPSCSRSASKLCRH